VELRSLSWVVSSPALTDELVFTGTSDGHFFQAVDIESGEEKWRFSTSSRIFSSGALAGDTVYFGCFDGFLYAVDSETGRELWRFRTGGRVVSSPAVAGGAVYFGSDDGRLYALKGSTLPATGWEPLMRAVFWQEIEGFTWFREGSRIRDYFREEGYEVLDGPGLAAFMTSRIEDRRPSVIVFGADRMPGEAGPGPGPDTVYRSYLEAGGKIVWPGLPPFSLKSDPETGKVTGLDLARASGALGVSYEMMGFDALGVRPTAEGRRWGLEGWWIGSGGIDPGEVTTVLATDEEGRAVSWVKSFGGPEGTGFVRIWGGQEIPFSLAGLRAAAEFRGGGS
jgi:hypothetical protein